MREEGRGDRTALIRPFDTARATISPSPSSIRPGLCSSLAARPQRRSLSSRRSRRGWSPTANTCRFRRHRSRSMSSSESRSSLTRSARRWASAGASSSGGSGGMAAAFMAMNDVYGKEFFKVHEEEMFEPAACRENGPPDDLFVFDDQTHIVRNTLEQGRGLRALAQGPGKASTCSSPFKTSKPARCGRTSTATPFRTSSGARAQRQLHQGAEAVRPDGRTAQQRAPWLDPHADLTLRQEPGFFVEPGSTSPPGRVATSRGARAPQARFKIACVVPQAAARAPTRCFLTARSAAA